MELIMKLLMQHYSYLWMHFNIIVNNLRDCVLYMQHLHLFSLFNVLFFFTHNFHELEDFPTEVGCRNEPSGFTRLGNGLPVVKYNASPMNKVYQRKGTRPNPYERKEVAFGASGRERASPTNYHILE